MASIFEQTIVPKLQFSNFPLDEWQLVSQNFGQLVPVYVREVVANDVFTLKAFMDVEFAPMVAPMFQEVNVSLHFFFVPDRLVWEDFETFMTGSEDGHVLPDDEIPGERGIPKTSFHGLCNNEDSLQGTILDYIGLPNQLAKSTTDSEIVDDTVIRDYFLIWYEYYRDENLNVQFVYNNSSAQTKTMSYFDFKRMWKRNNRILDALDNLEGDLKPISPEHALYSAMNGFSPFYRAWRKDYFTAALQTPQKGDPVTINLGAEAPVMLDPVRIEKRNETLPGLKFGWSGVVSPDSSVVTANIPGDPATNESTLYDLENDAGNLQWIEGLVRNATTLTQREIVGVADLSRASAITVENLREAFAVQEILESLSMRGSRFSEWLKGNFGVVPDDYRLQKPQFLGGIVTPVMVQKVLQTSGYSGEDARDMTGYAAGRAFAAAQDRVFRMRFKEPGYIIGIASVMPKAYYFQGIPRHFLRHDRFDYYLPQTAHLGEQGIENQELYYEPGNPTLNKKVFGYIPRWAEYKTSTSGIHGDFRGSLSYYHMARIFNSTPTLSPQFISTANLQTRPFAVWQAENPNINHLLWCNYFFKVVGSRPMPYHSVPKIM